MTSSFRADQIDNMVSLGAKGLIVIAEDGAAAVTPVEKAVAAGVPVISYDRLIKTSKIAAYLSFDNVEVGKQEALGVMTALGLPGSTTWTKANPAKVVLSGGSPTITTLSWFARARSPFTSPTLTRASSRSWLTSGWKTGIPPKAEAMMENILTATRTRSTQ